ncbi:MAG: dTDP-4-dehydrorhamnose 3,5-epimerase [Solirubrobacteraceae bacterium]|nr:dTDP-4-dehydrorhamnose 3,5-epimerase [Solirubrobacteraceae bacterium]
MSRSVDDLEVTPEAERDPPTATPTGERLARIDGVELMRLAPHADHRGSLTEVLNQAQPFWSEPVVHSYLFTIRPGRIKGWGMHKRQVDRYLGVRGEIRVVLFDGRVDSATYRTYDQYFMGEELPSLLRIPPGVWHADQNVGPREAAVLNFPTVAYDPAQPDKYRIDPHSGEIPFDWASLDG